MASNNPESTEGTNIRALVIYVFNENTGVLESASQLVNTQGKAKNFPNNVANAKKILDGNDTLLQVYTSFLIAFLVLLIYKQKCTICQGFL
jgi:hypothetical protein